MSKSMNLQQLLWLNQSHMVDHAQTVKSVIVTLLLGHIGMSNILFGTGLCSVGHNLPPLILVELTYQTKNSHYPTIISDGPVLIKSSGWLNAGTHYISHTAEQVKKTCD